MPVQALTQVDPKQFFNLPSTNGTETQRLNTQGSGVAVSNDFSGRLTVTTAEGDKITLTADLEARYQAVSYQGHAESNGTTVDVSAKNTEFSLKQQYGVTVEGDLNEEELHDLEKLFRKVSNIFRKFFRGQDDEALAKTAKLAERFGNLSSLSDLDLSVDVERSVTVLAAQVASEVTGHPEDGENPKSLATQVLEVLEEAEVELRKVRKYLPDFFKKLREDLRDELGRTGGLAPFFLAPVLKAGQAPPQTAEPVPKQKSATDVPSPMANSSMLFAYRTVSQTSVSGLIRS